MLFANTSTVKSDRVLYTPSSFARSSLLYMQETGKLRATAIHKSERSNLLSYLFFVIISGAGELTYNSKRYELTKGDCVFIDCRCPYAHMTSSDLWKLSWVHFNGPEMGGIYEKYKSRGGDVVFRPDDISEYKNILDDIFKLACSESYVRDMEINMKLSELLVLLMKDSWNPQNRGEKRSLIFEIKAYLDSNYSKKINLDKLSETFYIDKYYLSKLFKEQYGIPINEYLIFVRITKSKELLRFTEKSMEEIASDVGINGATYFSRVFKKVEGVNPSEYRKMW